MNLNYHPYLSENLPSRPSPSSYIGMSKEDALASSTRDGWIMHIGYEDGVQLPCSASLCYHRFQAYVSNGIVTGTGVIG